MARQIPKLRAAVDLRNLLIHGYAKVDNRIIWNSAPAGAGAGTGVRRWRRRARPFCARAPAGASCGCGWRSGSPRRVRRHR
nr:HepT-like ribonuclease domain-containing protein [Thioalkalivibrio sp. ALE21]